VIKWWKNSGDMFSRFGTIVDRDKQTDRRTERQIVVLTL